MTKQQAPNIVFISAEQQRGDTVHYTGADFMITPRMDQLASESVVFDSAFSCASTCIASRAAFYTGLYPHNTGMYCFYRSSGHLHWLNRLSDAGYHCTSIGKTHLPHMGYEESIAEQGNKYERYNPDKPSEWQQAVLAAGYKLPLDMHETLPDYYDRLCAVDCPLPEELHPDFFVTQKALEWLDREELNEPFYLHIGLLSPHDLYDPPKRFLDMYSDDDIPMPDVSEEELAGIPEELFAAGKVNEQRHYTTNLRPSHATPERIRRMRKHYFASVTMIDEKIGEILDKLKEKGLYDNSIIIFTSDHGDNLFDHGLFYKGELFDTITHIPLMIKAPDTIEPGTIRSDLVSHLDLAQYILEKAGVPADDLDGISLVPVVENGDTHPRTHVFAEEGASGLRPEPNLIAMMRSKEYKIIHFVGSDNGQLFDLKKDPLEKHNLWNSPEYESLKSQLTHEMLDWLYGNLFKHRDLFVNAR
ncbi:MAG: sulfatase-like hydrolase/transferase [Methanosarcinaceae archaeon]|nr:sulfatase-like hydrolase/transferase [Methanosarcinaceae archaeon]